MKTKEIVRLKIRKYAPCYMEFRKKGGLHEWKVVKQKHESGKILRLDKSHGLFKLKHERGEGVNFTVEVRISNAQSITLLKVPITFLHIKSYGKVGGAFDFTDLWDSSGKDLVGVWEYDQS